MTRAVKADVHEIGATVWSSALRIRIQLRDTHAMCIRGVVAIRQTTNSTGANMVTVRYM